MISKDIKALTRVIAYFHTEFAGHPTDPAFIEKSLQKARKYLQSEENARECNYEAKLWIPLPGDKYGEGASPTIINIRLAEDGESLIYTEKFKNKAMNERIKL